MENINNAAALYTCTFCGKRDILTSHIYNLRQTSTIDDTKITETAIK